MATNTKIVKRDEEDQDDQIPMVVVDKIIRPHLPNLVIHRIQSLLPTKSALRMSFLSKQWEGVWSLSPVIDFDQGGTHTDDEDNIKFINILERYLEFRLKDKQLLDKFRLHMRYHGEGRTVTIVDMWVRFAVMRSVKELDISLRSIWPDYYYLSLENLGGKSITTLNLEYVAIDKISNELSLPSLKYVSLKTVRMDYLVIHRLISECPSMEYLSLTSCSLIDRGKMSLATLFLYTSSSYNNLKTLEVRDCMFSYIQVTGINLESFTLDSRYRHLKRVALIYSHSLKYININAQYLQEFELGGCHSSVKITINTPNLLTLNFFGYFNSCFSMEAPNLSKAIIRLWDWQSTFDLSWKHFSTLKGFLKEFGSCQEIRLFANDVEALIFPEEYRNTFPPLLPSLTSLKVMITGNPSSAAAKDSKLRNSLYWMAPSAIVMIM